MKYVFLGTFTVLLVLSGVAWVWQPRATDDRIELVWCVDDNPMRREQIALFNRLYPQYRLTLDPQNSTTAKVIVQSLAGVGPDLFDCYSGFQLNAFVRAGIALDCTEALAAHGVDPEAVWPALKPVIIHEGRLYGHPGNAHASAIWYNKKLFDRAGVPYPSGDWTWDDLVALGRQLVVRDSRGQVVQYALLMSDYDWAAFPYQFGASTYNAEGTRCVLDSPEACRALQFLQDLIHEHHLMPSPMQRSAMATTGGWGSGTITLFGAERSAMAIGGRWWLCSLREDSYSHLDLGAAPMPGVRMADGTIRRRIVGGGRATLVNANSANIDGALCFLECLHGEEWNKLINRQADALGSVMAYNYTDEFLLNPAHPNEDYNTVWRSAMENAAPQQVSPYVNGDIAERLLNVQLDLARANQKSGADAMRDAARKINEAIVETLERDPVLRERYFAALDRGAAPAWDSEEDAP